VSVHPSQIRAARALLAWTQTDLADRSGTSKRSIVSLESEDPVSADVLRAVLHALAAAGIEFRTEADRLTISGPRPLTAPRD
jgi:transcriptional regulator with XRE-family HTH domain